MRITDLISSELIAGIVGSVVGAFVSFRFFKNYEKKKFTLEFHKEWNSKETSIIRRMADKCIMNHPTVNYGEIRFKDEDGSVYVYIVMRFFQRLWICVKSNNVSRSLSVNLFKDFFLYWYFISYEANLMPLKNEFIAANELDEFYTWMKANVSFAEFDKLKKKYQEEYQKRIALNKESKVKLVSNELGNLNTITFKNPSKNISSFSVQQTPPKHSLSFFEQIKILELKEQKRTNDEIIKYFIEEQLIKDSDGDRSDVLKEYLRIMSGEEKEYYNKLKKIIIDKLKNETDIL